MMQFPKQIFSSFVLRALFGSFFIFAAGSHFTFVHPGIAQEIKTVLRGSVLSMLEAINKIRTRRHIKLDCSEYVYRYLGRSDTLKHYIDLFAASGIQPSVVRQYENRHNWCSKLE